MKKSIYLLIAFFVVIVILMPVSLFFLPSKVNERKRNLYIEYINSIIPNPYAEDIKTLTGRKNIEKMSQAIKAYYKACNEKNIDFVKDILNVEYVNYMNIDLNNLVKFNDDVTIDAKKIEINTIYEAGNNIYFAVVKDVSNIHYTGILLDEKEQKYSIIFDGIYNKGIVVEHEKDYQLNEYGDESI